MIATRKVITLRPLFTALAPFNACQLFQFSMQLLYTPTHLILFLNYLRLNRTWVTIRDYPFNVAICSDSLEKLHCKRNFLEFDVDSFLKLFWSPFNLPQVNIVLLFTQTNETIFFQSRHKKFSKSMNKLEIFHSRIPTIEQNGLRLKAFLFKSLTQHILEVVIFCFAISIGGIHAKIEWMIITLMHMN